MTDALMDRIKAHRSAPDVYDPPTFDQMADYIEKTEAKLTNAVEALRNLLNLDDDCPTFGVDLLDTVVRTWEEAAATLAELEGKE